MVQVLVVSYRPSVPDVCTNYGFITFYRIELIVKTKTTRQTRHMDEPTQAAVTSGYKFKLLIFIPFFILILFPLKKTSNVSGM